MGNAAGKSADGVHFLGLAQLLLGAPLPGNVQDRSGDLLVERLENAGHHLFDRQLLPDDIYAIRAAVSQWIAATDKAVADKLDAKLAKMTAKTKKCGPVLTYELLKDAHTDKECFETVKACYTLLAKDHGYIFVDYRDPFNTLTPTQALLSEMKLLWMRRKPDPNDVLHWLKETVK